MRRPFIVIIFNLELFVFEGVDLPVHLLVAITVDDLLLFVLIV